jgi:hypothetical protein
MVPHTFLVELLQNRKKFVTWCPVVPFIFEVKMAPMQQESLWPDAFRSIYHYSSA